MMETTLVVMVVMHFAMLKLAFIATMVILYSNMIHALKYVVTEKILVTTGVMMVTQNLGMAALLFVISKEAILAQVEHQLNLMYALKYVEMA